MFPHTITVFTKDENTDKYTRIQIEGVYWYGSDNRTLSGKGVDDGSSVTIVMPLIKFEGIEKGSLIIKGVYSDEINSKSELNSVEYITVESISIKDVGSNIDHVTIKGVEQYAHIIDF